MCRRSVSLLPVLVLALCFAQVRLFAQQQDDSQPAEEETQQAKPGHDSTTKQDKEAVESRQTEESSSKDTRVDLSPPANDAKSHPNSGAAIYDAEQPNDVDEFHPWDPHKAAKDVEVGDFYFKRKNYRAASDRYQEALVYKPNDAVATFRLAQSEEKSGQPADAITHYEAYLKILPHGPDAEQAQKSLEHLKAGAEKQTSSK
jgi:tetratricopeptide (TPR) repeat protein